MAVAKLAAFAAVVGTLVILPSAHAAPGTGTLFGTDASGGNLIAVKSNHRSRHRRGEHEAGVVPALAVDPTTGTCTPGRAQVSPLSSRSTRRPASRRSWATPAWD